MYCPTHIHQLRRAISNARTAELTTLRFAEGAVDLKRAVRWQRIGIVRRSAVEAVAHKARRYCADCLYS